MEETYTDIYLDNETERNSEKLIANDKKLKITTEKDNKSLKFSDNYHIADVQQRLIRLEYELLYIKDKLFEESRTKTQPKLSAYGKVVKKRLLANG